MIKLERYINNPIMTANPSNAWESQNVSNTAATIFNDKIMLLYRAEGFEPRSGRIQWPVSRIGLAISSDGFHIDERFPEPVIDIMGKEYESWGVEDPRISRIGDTYYIVYAVGGELEDQLALATTRDFRTFERHGLLTPDISQRTSTLLPEKIKGKYVLLHRIIPNMWISYSDNLKDWHDTKVVMRTRLGKWDEAKLGIGAQPIKTELGWLLFTHGVDRHRRYALGLALLDLEDPAKLIYRQDEPIMEVEEDYEKNGYYPNVIYTCGAVEKDGRYLVYYGCADRCLSLATISTAELMSELKRKLS